MKYIFIENEIVTNDHQLNSPKAARNIILCSIVRLQIAVNSRRYEQQLGTRKDELMKNTQTTAENSFD